VVLVTRRSLGLGRGIAKKLRQALPAVTVARALSGQKRKLPLAEKPRNCVSRWALPPTPEISAGLQGNLAGWMKGTGLVLFALHALHLWAAWMPCRQNNAGMGPPRVGADITENWAKESYDEVNVGGVKI